MSNNTLTIIQLIFAALAGVGASSGFWVYMDNRRKRRDLSTKLLIGLAHDRIICLSLQYIERGYITTDEFENLHEFLFKPYSELGGNGSAIRLMDQVKKLPLYHHSRKVDDACILQPRKEKLDVAQ